LAASAASCGGVLLGDPVPCEHDSTCPNGFICEDRTVDEAAARVCVAAIECTGDGQCPVGSTCIERTVTPPDNPFEGDHPRKQVCDCLDECGTGGFNAGGQGGEPAGGEPAGGQGGEPAGGQGGEPAGGAGGAR
jgi:hypothetical protein